ncbi:MAG: hypothetical protein WCE68_08380 [Anaerolineales bacterium]
MLTGKKVFRLAGSVFFIIIMAGCRAVGGLPPTGTAAPVATGALVASSTATATPEAPTITRTPEPSATPTVTAIPVDIFNASTFPDQYQAMAANPFSGTPQQQADYQAFLNIQREALPGAADTIEKMKSDGKIHTEQADLWWALYAASQQKTPEVVILGPGDLQQAMDIESADWVRTGNVNEWFEPQQIDGKSWQYQFKDKINSDMSGIFVGVGQVDSSSNRVLIWAYKNQQSGIWSLYMRTLINDPQFKFKSGSACHQLGRLPLGTAYTLDEDAPWGNTGGGPDEKTLLGKIGRSIDIISYTHAYQYWLMDYIKRKPTLNGWDVFCELPYQNLFPAGQIEFTEFLPVYPNMPWSDTASPPATPTVKP